MSLRSNSHREGLSRSVTWLPQCRRWLCRCRCGRRSRGPFHTSNSFSITPSRCGRSWRRKKGGGGGAGEGAQRDEDPGSPPRRSLLTEEEKEEKEEAPAHSSRGASWQRHMQGWYCWFFSRCVPSRCRQAPRSWPVWTRRIVMQWAGFAGIAPRAVPPP